MSTDTTIFDDDTVAARPRERARSRGQMRWQHEFGAARDRRLAASTLWFALGYGLLLGVDVWLVEDALALSVISRLGVVAPIALMAAALIRRGVRQNLRDPLAVVPALIAVVTTALVFLASRAPTAVHFHHLIALPILYVNIVQRPRTRVAAIASLIVVVVDWSTLILAAIDPPVALAAAFETVMLVGLSLMAGYGVERELRRAYLLRLRSEKAVDHLASRNVELKELSQIDTLTGLANRRRLDLRLADVAEWSRRTRESVAVLMIDVDRFKQFNDRYGHPEGDRCLARVAQAASEQVRRHDDMVGRFGGEEFLAILPGTDVAGAAKVAERIRSAVEALAIDHAGCVPHGVVAVSIGCAAAAIGDAWGVEDLVQAADDALYAAKRRGRNRVHPPPRANEGPPEPSIRARRPGIAA